jgi:hypothetical protein
MNDWLSPFDIVNSKNPNLTTTMAIRLDLIRNSIENNKCVLVLGPKLYYKEIDGKMVDRQLFFSEIEKEYKSSIYFANEELFSITDSDEKTALLMSLQKFYKGGGDANLLELISSIRFPLIMNASPDLALKQFCDGNEVPLEFEAFDRKDLKKESLEFSKERPLLYNIMGSVKEWDKIILEHKELFEHFQKLLPLGSMPESIVKFLNRANCYLFLGFEFDSWVFQLVSYIILNQKDGEDNNNKKKYSYLKLPEETVTNILHRRSSFQIKSKDLDRNQTMCVLMDCTLNMQFTDITPAELLSKITTTLIENERNLPERNRNTRNVRDQEKYSVYLSYKHYDQNGKANETDENSRDKFNKLDALNQGFIQEFHHRNSANSHVKLMFDKEQINYGQSIDSFMTRIGKGKAVVMIVSHNYLTSQYCMTEMFRILKYSNEEKRIFIIWVEDDVQDKQAYEQYWQEESVRLLKMKVSFDKIEAAYQFSNGFLFPIKRKEDDLFLPVCLDDFTKRDNTGYELNPELKNNMCKFINDIINKLKE